MCVCECVCVRVCVRERERERAGAYHVCVVCVTFDNGVRLDIAASCNSMHAKCQS